MKTELQDKLIAKYPEFFEHCKPRKIYTKNSLSDTQELLAQKEMVLPIQFGFECGDGWYMLLDELMSHIKNHMNNVNRNIDSEFKYRWMQKLSYHLRIRTSAKQKRLRKLGDWIYANAPKGGKPHMILQIDQIKEKFGGLRFYYTGGDNTIDGMVSLAEGLSYRICEDCGTTKNIGRTSGWIRYICLECHEKIDPAKRVTWTPIIKQ